MSDLKVKVLLDIVPLDEDAKGSSQDTIQVVQYNDHPAQLVKRQYYKKKSEDTWSPGKAKGLNATDWILLTKSKDFRKEIRTHLKGE